MKNKGLWITLGVVALLLIIGVGGYNRLVTLNESIDGQWAQVENVLKRRYDLIPNLVATVKGYAKHEQELLTKITELRSQWGKAQTKQDRLTAASGLEGMLGRLMVVMERYPDLKANQNFLRLQDELAGTENRIATERRRYNETVRQYNIMVRRFPTNLTDSIFGFSKRDEYFEVEEAAKEVPKVEF